MIITRRIDEPLSAPLGVAHGHELHFPFTNYAGALAAARQLVERDGGTAYIVELRDGVPIVADLSAAPERRMGQSPAPCFLGIAQGPDKR